MNTSHNEYDMTVNSILVVLVYAFSISMRNSSKMFDKPTQTESCSHANAYFTLLSPKREIHFHRSDTYI